jgi:hypothetical protein
VTTATVPGRKEWGQPYVVRDVNRISLSNVTLEYPGSYNP